MVTFNSLKHDIFPGHALVIAIRIMEEYSSLEDAQKPAFSYGKVFDFPDALGNEAIPGGGGPVYSALSLLEMEDDDKAIEWANYCWEGECSTGYKERLEPGKQAAKELEPLFKELRMKWKLSKCKS